MPGQFERKYMDGEPLSARQHQAILAAERKVRRRYAGFRFQCLQGSWQPETSYSGTSHTNAGAADLSYWNISSRTRAGKKKYAFVLRCLRDCGQAAFGRGPWTKMSYHMHVLDLDTRFMDEHVGYGAVWQVGEYRNGNDGLTAGRDDPFPYRPKPLREWDYR